MSAHPSIEREITPDNVVHLHDAACRVAAPDDGSALVRRGDWVRVPAPGQDAVVLPLSWLSVAHKPKDAGINFSGRCLGRHRWGAWKVVARQDETETLAWNRWCLRCGRCNGAISVGDMPNPGLIRRRQSILFDP